MIKTIKKDLFLEYANENIENQLLAEFILKGFPEETRELTLLEVMTMILKYVKLEAEKFVKGPIKDAVLILPNFWTIHQRNFLVQAASVADLYIMSIINENTAWNPTFDKFSLVGKQKMTLASNNSKSSANAPMNSLKLLTRN